MYSAYRLIFIDDGFHEDDLAKFGTDAALMQMIMCHDQSIVPVRAHVNIKMPPLLCMFKSFEVHRLLRGQRLDDIEVSLLTESDIDMSLLKTFVQKVSRHISRKPKHYWGLGALFFPFSSSFLSLSFRSFSSVFYRLSSFLRISHFLPLL